MVTFDFVEPTSLADALEQLDGDDPTVRPFAGGTALMLMMKSGAFFPSRLVSLRRIDGFSGIRRLDDGALEIGATTTMSDIEHSSLIRRHLPVVSHAMKRLANVRVRNVACLGGALAHGDPHMDLPPIFASLGAVAVIVGPAGERTIPVVDLYRGYYETVLANDELIRSVRVPSQAGRAATYLKCTTRSADDWPALGVAVNARPGDGALDDVRIVVGAVTEKPTRLVEAERELAGGALDAARIDRVCDAAHAAVLPESDVRGSAAYKRELVRVYVGRALRATLASAAA